MLKFNDSIPTTLGMVQFYSLTLIRGLSLPAVCNILQPNSFSSIFRNSLAKPKIKFLVLKHLSFLFTLMFCFSISDSAMGQCTDVQMLATEGASISNSGTGGLCLFCNVSNEGNITNSNTSDYASISIPLGVGGYGYVRISLPQTYPGGTRVGWLADVNGVAGLFNSVTMIARNNGSVVQTVSSSSLFSILGIGGNSNINAIFCSPFDEVEIRMGSIIGKLANYRVFNAYISEDCNFPVNCGGTPTTELCGDGIDNDGNGLVDNEDVCTVPCLAGDNAPSLSSNTLANICPNTNANLNSIMAINTPLGAVLSWHTASPATLANQVANPLSVGEGNYFASFHDVVSDCFSDDGNATTSIVVNISSCCSAGSPAPILIQN